MTASQIELPPCGLFLGTGVYPMSADYLLSTWHGHLSWTPQTFSPLEMLEKVIEDNQGNLVQFWGIPRGYAPAMIAEWLYALDEIGVHLPNPDWKTGAYVRPGDCAEFEEYAIRRGAGALRFAREAAARGLYTAFIYVDGEPQWSAQLASLGEYYLGYDFGERYTFALDEGCLAGKALDTVTLGDLAGDLMARVREHVDERKATGWGPVMATSSSFHIDYEVAAGADIPLIEDFAFAHLNLASALSRGMTRQYDLPLWGSHLAHEHYSWIPYASPYKFPLLRAALYQKCLAGSKMIVNESGNWFVEASLVEDSPKHDLPATDLAPDEVTYYDGDAMRFAPYIEAARKHYPSIGYDAPECRKYRSVISDFYDFVKAEGTPPGQPEATLAVVKGNLDLCSHRFNPNYAIAGAYSLADRNPSWFEGTPERGWETVKETFYPLMPVLGEHQNLWLSGTPYGMVDVVSFAADRVDAAVLGRHYQALLFAGWNTASEHQYGELRAFVEAGGTLFISIPHLSTNKTRNYGSYGVEELVRGGDFSDLCGVKVKGRGERFYWATAPRGSEELGVRFPQRFGILATPMGDLEITDPAMETLLVDDEAGRPFLLRHRCGQGTVYFLNSWAYPGALDQNYGPGATRESPNLVGAIYRHLAERHRGTVYITDDGQTTGQACNYINISHFPEDRSTCLFNVDFDHPHRFHLHCPGGTEVVELGPGEFRRIRTAAQQTRPMLTACATTG